MEFKRFNKEIKVGNQRIMAEIIVSVGEDDFPLIGDDFDLGTDEENQSYLELFKNDELFNGIVAVEATALNLTGFDVKGSCPMHCDNPYDGSKFSKDVNAVLNDYNIVENAIDELIRKIEVRAKTLAPFAAARV